MAERKAMGGSAWPATYWQLETYEVRSGGTGYTVNTIVTIKESSSTQPVIWAVAVIAAGGVLQQLNARSLGSYALKPPDDVTLKVRTGTGSGAHVHCTWTQRSR